MNIVSIGKLIISSFYLLFIMLLLAGHKGACQTEFCHDSRCGVNEQRIRFPFRLDDQPTHCGILGFDLHCTRENKTAITLPGLEMEFLVRKISYESQKIYLYNKYYKCGLREEELQIFNRLKIAPFEFSSDHFSTIGSTLFNCSSNDGNGTKHCVMAIESRADMIGLYLRELVKCTKMFDISSLPPEMFRDSNFLLTWKQPSCTHCEAQGKRCGLVQKIAAESEIECFELISQPQKGGHGLEETTIAGGHGLEEIMTLGVILGAFLLIPAVLVISSILDKREGNKQLRITMFLDDYKALKPSRFTYSEIKKITNHFKEKLGQGTYGTVFKGKLLNEILVAVKVLNNSKGNGEEFINEVGTLGQIHHVNVVRLVGYCAEGFRRALVFEFLPNNSLEKYILSIARGSNRSLSWETLQDIALGIAKGIEYLHQGCEKRILHFDIKPNNILLDHNFKPKISDFGLAKLCSKDQSIVSMTKARGTIGYIAPEVFSNNFGNVSYKSDVYSFGMLLLEMVGGREITNMTEDNTSEVYYPEWIYSLLEEGKDLRIQIEEEGDTKIAKKLAIVGLWCIQWHPIGRPTMKAVVRMLEAGLEELTLPPNPFASIGPSKENNRVGARVQITLELQAIAE